MHININFKKTDRVLKLEFCCPSFFFEKRGITGEADKIIVLNGGVATLVQAYDSVGDRCLEIDNDFHITFPEDHNYDFSIYEEISNELYKSFEGFIYSGEIKLYEGDKYDPEEILFVKFKLPTHLRAKLGEVNVKEICFQGNGPLFAIENGFDYRYTIIEDALANSDCDYTEGFLEFIEETKLLQKKITKIVEKYKNK